MTNSWSRVFEAPVGPRPFEKLLVFVEPEGSQPCLQPPPNCSFREPNGGRIVTNIFNSFVHPLYKNDPPPRISSLTCPCDTCAFPLTSTSRSLNFFAFFISHHWVTDMYTRDRNGSSVFILTANPRKF